MAIDCNSCNREAVFIESDGAWCLEHYGAHLFNRAADLEERRRRLGIAAADYYTKLSQKIHGEEESEPW